MSDYDNGLLPLTSYQKDIWMQQEISGNTSEYNIGLTVRINHSIDKEKLVNTLETLAMSHDALRIKLVKREGEVYQVLSSYEGIFFTQEVWGNESEAIISQKIKQYFQEPFKMLEHSLVAYKLVDLSEKGYLLMLKYHHIIVDGDSVYKLFDRLFKLYYKLDSKVCALKSSYVNLIDSEHLYLQSNNYHEDKMFWNSYLSKKIEPLFDKASIQQNTISVKKIALDDELYKNLKAFCIEHQISLYQFLLAALIMQYSQLADKDEMLIGLTVHNRTTKKMRETVGYCVNEIPLYVKVEPKFTILEFVGQLKSKLFEVYRHGQLATSAILEGKTTDWSINYQQPLLNTADYELKGWEVNTVFNESLDKDLVVNITEQGNTNVELELQYRTNLFGDEALTSNLVDRIDLVLKAALKCHYIYEVSIATDEEKEKISRWNDTVVAKNENETVYHLFYKTTCQHPEALAVIDCEKSITYRELIKEVNQIARGLLVAGVVEGDKVALYLPKKIALISSMLAIWQVGAAYIPLDKHYPNERIQYILENSNAKYMIVEEGILPTKSVKCLEINTLKNYGEFTEEIKAMPYQNAYIIYTSGTTGLPKGVMIHQKQLANAITYRKVAYQFEKSHSILQIYSPCFDAFLAGTFTSLISGSKLVLPEDSEAKDPISIKKYIKQYGVTHIDMVPSFLKVILSMLQNEDVATLQAIIVGGEKVTAEIISMCHEKNPTAEVINEYGPTEATILATLAKNMTPQIANSIGKPIDNTRIYILNKQGNQMPIGIVGEMWIGGICVSEGYIGRADLNEKYFTKDLMNPKERMYKTGDNGKWTDDGIIEYVDRIDYQVKIRGYRIELREIEEQLKKIPGILDNIVVDLGEGENRYLCAYYVATKGISEELIKDFLGNILPSYMIPTYCIQLEAIPLSSNGKKDRKQLPLPKVITKTYEKPATETEKNLEKILLTLIKTEHIGKNDNLFELGAHSLTIAMATSRIYKVFKKEVSLQFIFEHPTIKEIAQLIDEKECTDYQIIKQKEEKYYNLTSVQSRLFFLEKWQPNTTLYNMPLLIDLQEDVVHDQLEKAFYKVIERNESLRTNFEEIDGICKQTVRENFDFKVDNLVINKDFVAVAEGLIRPFDLKAELLIRATLINNGNQKKLFVELHHIIADGMSTTILLEELLKAYEGIDLPKKNLQFHDYVEWERNLELKMQEEYWLRTYQTMPTPLSMPLDFLRPKEQSFKGESFRTSVPNELVEDIYEFTKQNDTTPNMVLMSAYSILLSKYTNQEDLVIGIPSLGRNNGQVEDMIGMFVRSLPLRMQPLGQLKIKDYLIETKKMILNAFENQYYPLENLINQLKIERDASRNPLFDTMFVYQPKVESLKCNNVYRGQMEVPNKIAKFDFTFNIQESDQGMAIVLEYCTDLYKKETMENLMKHYFYVISQIVNEKAITIKEIELASPEEKQEIKALNNRCKKYDATTIVRLFEEQVKASPCEIAVVDKKTSLTYDVLNKRANQLAHYLLAQGIKKEDRVALRMSRSTCTAITMLGIMKAGGAYVPIDISYPQARVDFILKDSGSRWLIDENMLEEIVDYPCYNPQVDIEPNHLAYVIYTSGTTGMPKGVMIEHKNITNTLMHEKETYNLNKADSTIILFSSSFDGFVLTFFSFIISGGKVILPSEDEGKDIFKISYYIRKYQVTYMIIVPSLFSIIIEDLDKEDLRSVKYIKLAGEKTSKEIIALCKEKELDAELINAYGPTETAVEATLQRHMNEENNNSIGLPITNAEVFIVNQYQQILPKGVIGEIAIAGAGVARGYLNSEKLTRSKFIPCPFNHDKKMYLTGDMGRWSLDDKIEFLGRADDQVKIRGFRIEIQEIERQIGKVKDVKEACVVVKGEQQKYLSAYFTAKKALSQEEIKEELQNILPEYMIPSVFMQLDKMPVTPNGKIDRAKLPQPIQKVGTKKMIPTCEEERIIFNIWKDVLDRDDIGLEDSFFHIGGDSIKSIQVAARLIKLGYQVETRTIMKYPTIKQLVKQLKPIENSYGLETVVGEIPFTPIQKWFLQGQKEGLSHFNQSFILQMQGEIDVKIMKDTFNVLMGLHDALRMKFYKDDKGCWRQYNQNTDCGIKDFYVWQIDNECPETTIKDSVASYQQTLDIQVGRLIRVDIFKGVDRDYMSIIIHHLVVDGVSFRIILEDMEEIYNELLKGRTPNLIKTSSFKDWSKALERCRENGFISSEEKGYWQEISHRMSLDKRSYLTCRECGFINFDLDEALTLELLQKVNAFYQTKLNDVLLTALSRAFYKWDKSKLLSIALEGHGREFVEEKINTTRTVGWFTSAYPVLVEYDGIMASHIQKTKANLEGITHNGIGYGILRYLHSEECNLEGVSRVGFNYLGVMDQKRNQNLFEFADIPSENAIGKEWVGFHEIDINSSVIKRKLRFEIAYAYSLYTKEQIEMLGNLFLMELKSIIEHCNLKLKHIPAVYEIEGVCAFKEIFYRDCFYHALFPALTAYNISLLPYLYNSIASYEYDKNMGGLVAKDIERVPLDLLINQYGLKTKKIQMEVQPVDPICLSIAEGKAMILPVDCYDLSYRTDTYQKTHWRHTVLVYGYNQVENTFRIIDHEDVNSQVFINKTVGFKDIENAYLGYKEHFPTEESDAYQLERDLEEYRDDPEIVREQYAHFIQKEKVQLNKNLEYLELYQEDLQMILNEVNRDEPIWQETLYNLNGIVKSKIAEAYKVNQGMEKTEQEGIISEVVKTWMIIRSKIQRYVLTGRKDAVEIKRLLENVYKLEKNYLACLIKQEGKGEGLKWLN